MSEQPFDQNQFSIDKNLYGYEENIIDQDTAKVMQKKFKCKKDIK